jgi:hypothetical protein
LPTLFHSPSDLFSDLATFYCLLNTGTPSISGHTTFLGS